MEGRTDQHRTRAIRPRRRTALISALTLGTAMVAVAGPDWDGDTMEDAGETPATAQKVASDTTSDVKTIAGMLSEAPGLVSGVRDYVDMYAVRITQPTRFSVTTGGKVGSAEFDSVLWVFAGDGTARLANDDAKAGSAAARVGRFSTDGSVQIDEPGLYFVAITGAGSIAPVTKAGAPMFQPFEAGVVSAATSIGLTQPVDRWLGTGEVGAYVISLEGVSPLPASCGSINAGPCEQVRDTPFCREAPCCIATCTIDQTCCEVAWDEQCVQIASFICDFSSNNGCGSPIAGPCGQPNDTPYCRRPVCCALVCQESPFCCEIEWDVSCVALANQICPDLCDGPCPGDLNADQRVDGEDLGQVLSQWGASTGTCADLDGNGQVDGADLAVILANWGACDDAG